MLKAALVTMACVFPLFVSLNLTKCLMLLILVAEVIGAPVQIQKTPFEYDEDTVVLYCKSIGVHLQWDLNGFTLGNFDGNEEVGAVKKRTESDNTVATAILFSKAPNSDNITVRTSVLILNKNFIEDRPIRVDCLGGGMDQASYTHWEQLSGNNSQRTDSTSSEATTISLDNPTSISSPDFPTLGFEMASVPSNSVGVSLSLVLLTHLVASSIFL